MNAMNAEYVVDELRLKALDNPNGGGWVAETNENYRMLAEQGYAETDNLPDEDGDVFYRVTDAGRQWLEASRRGESALAKGEEPKPAKVMADPAGAHAPIEGPSPGRPVGSKNAKPRNAKAPAAPAPTLAPSDPRWPHISADYDVGDEEWNKPEARGFGRGAASNGFLAALDLDSLPVGASRHIACTEKVQYPWRTYGYYISQYNKQFAVQLRDENGRPMARQRRKRGGGGVIATIPICSYTKKFVIFRAREGDPRGPGARVLREI